jgi:GcrA cell cycle regulator
MEWNDDTVGRLRGLWDEGHSTAEIGRRLGVSKNAVVGKAHRLGLAARPSPIRKDPSGRRRPPPPRRVIGPTLPPLSATAATIPPLRSAISAPFPVPAGPPPSVPEAAPAPMPAAPALSLAPRAPGRLHACCWPMGEPGTRSFRFCDAEALPGKPYCDEHAQVAYVRVRDRREEAA